MRITGMSETLFMQIIGIKLPGHRVIGSLSLSRHKVFTSIWFVWLIWCVSIVWFISFLGKGGFLVLSFDLLWVEVFRPHLLSKHAVPIPAC
jgi:hypothetical protein